MLAQLKGLNLKWPQGSNGPESAVPDRVIEQKYSQTVDKILDL